MKRDKTNIRQLRIQKDILKLLSQIIFKEIKDVRVEKAGCVINEVVLSPDLTSARVYVAFIERDLSDNDQKEVLRILNDAEGFLRSKLTKSIKMKSIPRLQFYYDDFLDEVVKMEQSLAEEKLEIEDITRSKD
ncbi:MAG: 30S ribosome-binding factor RbfA [Candidatus Cloacimonetes bacterium]|nr:30S ribosome-binding factor RbfA [Candidatus Cloacimonadota bacterium]